MKKVLLSFMFACLCNFGMSQNNADQGNVDLLNDVRNIDFYGVDFSLAKVMGADESLAKFAEAFEAINLLLINEQSKYNLEKFLNKDNVALHLKHLNKSYAKVAADEDFKIYNDEYKIDIEDVKTQIQGYKDVDYKYEVGAVLIAELLNKSKGYATYYFAFFDNKTKEIIAIYPMKCKIGGFGLRNFWASSVLEAMKGLKKQMK